MMECFITFVIINSRGDNDGMFQYLCHLSVSINQSRRGKMMEYFITFFICLWVSINPRGYNDGLFHYHCHQSEGTNQSQTR